MPAIVTPPASVAITAGQTATFSVAATGTSPSYQWYRSGAPIDGATSASYVTPVQSALDAGHLYSVRVSNAAGSVVSAAATLTVDARFRTPGITRQPLGQTVAAGQPATFSVEATGAGPLSYQWRLNGSNIAGATAASYTTPAFTATTGPAARYSVRVTNSVANVTSTDAVLTVAASAAAPDLSSVPTSQAAILGQTTTLTATPGGTGPFSYQWRRDGVAIVGATGSSYSTAPVTRADAGARFSVVATNAVGATTSADIPLTIVDSWIGTREDGGVLVGGASAVDSARGIAADGNGNVFIAGRTQGQFGFDAPGQTSSAFVVKYNNFGVPIWAHKSQASGPFVSGDLAHAVAVDAGLNVYVAGQTSGTLPGELSANNADITVTKYSNDGTLLWAKQFGSSSDDAAYGIAVDASGNVFVGGQARDQLPGQPPASGLNFIAKFDTNGNRQWIRQFGAGFYNGAAESVTGVAVDAAGNAYVSGTIYGAFAGAPIDPDAFAAKFDTNGNRLWFTRPRGLGNDGANAVAVSADGAAVYMTGRTYSDFDIAGYPAQNRLCCAQDDVFTMRLDGGTGAIQWAHNLTSVQGTNTTYFYDEAFGITTNTTGSAVFITGVTAGQMPGDTSKGDEDIFVVRYEADGTRTWVRQYGSDIPATGARNDKAWAATYDASSNILFVGGESRGSFGLPGRITNGPDFFVMPLRSTNGIAF